MVTINTMSAFDAYYGISTPSSVSTGDNTMKIILIGGLVLVSAAAIYLAIENNNLIKKIKSNSSKKLQET